MRRRWTFDLVAHARRLERKMPVVLPRGQLENCGWATLNLNLHTPSSLAHSVVEIARVLGEVIPTRDGDCFETLSPRSESEARPATLSRRFGYGALPLHCDTAHWLIPCRYIVLACAETGRIEAPTMLLDTHAISFSSEELLLARSASFIVRNGRKSFYANLIDTGLMRPSISTMLRKNSGALFVSSTSQAKRKSKPRDYR